MTLANPWTTHGGPWGVPAGTRGCAGWGSGRVSPWGSPSLFVCYKNKSLLTDLEFVRGFPDPADSPDQVAVAAVWDLPSTRAGGQDGIHGILWYTMVYHGMQWHIAGIPKFSGVSLLWSLRSPSMMSLSRCRLSVMELHLPGPWPSEVKTRPIVKQTPLQWCWATERVPSTQCEFPPW